jgi:thiol:disulfide interchange protein DsbD
MLQNPIVLIVFAGIFVALAFSLFGYYSLELPQSFQNKINSITNNKKQKGVFNIAIMGFLSALIVGPCVAPPLAGALMYIGQTGDAILGGLALFIMSLGLGMPLLLVGIGAGKYMPKPGGWMDNVSKIFGVVMLILAIFMLDRILPQIVIFLLYALLAFACAYYLKQSNKFGKIIAIILVIIGVYFVYLTTLNQTTNLKFQQIKTIKQLDKTIQNSNKPIILDFSASWCVSCKEMEHITFKNKAVQQYLKNYLLLRVDVTNNTKDDKALMKRFNIFGPPALIFWDKNHKEEKSKRIIGYKNPKEFLSIITGIGL